MGEGKITQVIGAVLDVRFEKEELPSLYNAIHIPFGDSYIVAEVMQHLGNDTVRCVAMSATEGLKRGMKAIDTGAPITVPVGDEVLGRVFNVLGEPVDDLGEPHSTDKWAIHIQQINGQSTEILLPLQTKSPLQKSLKQV